MNELWMRILKLRSERDRAQHPERRLRPKEGEETTRLHHSRLSNDPSEELRVGSLHCGAPDELASTVHLGLRKGAGPGNQSRASLDKDVIIYALLGDPSAFRTQPEDFLLSDHLVGVFAFRLDPAVAAASTERPRFAEFAKRT